MSEPTRKTFAEHLIAQDPPLSDEKYKEHRMQLEKALTDASGRESRVRMTVLVLWLLCLIIPMVVAGIVNGRVAVGANVGPPRIFYAYPLLMYVLLIVTLVETVSYFVRFLPARLRAGSALNRNILLDLDRRITDLAGRIDRTTGEDRPEQTPP
jgi:hypothetical protein